MQADLEQFKKDRAEAMRSGDITLLRSFAKRYAIKTLDAMTDQEVLTLAKTQSCWD